MIRPTCERTLVRKVRDLKNNYYSMTFGPYSRAGECRPGSFLHVRMPGSEIYFRRAMSVAGIDTRKGEIEIIFKIFGRGTTILSKYTRGDTVDILGPLGVPFSAPKKNERVLIVAGGVGFPPLLYLAADLIRKGLDARRIEFFYGGRSSTDLVERARIKKLGVNFHPFTDDGSYGGDGMVTAPVERFVHEHQGEKLRIYACGPEPMLKAADQIGLRSDIPGQLSLEAPMPCGIGVCLGCVVPLTVGGYARVCCDGPVFNIGEVKL
ncbi:MAG: dihydroorotate dehydrogenase electron transfer subunit [Candidatus Zixiibacteriota bacterium]